MHRWCGIIAYTTLWSIIAVIPYAPRIRYIGYKTYWHITTAYHFNKWDEQSVDHKPNSKYNTGTIKYKYPIRTGVVHTVMCWKLAIYSV